MFQIWLNYFGNLFQPISCKLFPFFFTAFRSSHRKCYVKKSFPKKFSNLTGKHLYLSLFLIKLQPSGLQLIKKRIQHRYLPVKSCKIFKNINFVEHLRMTASVLSSISVAIVEFWKTLREAL